MTYLFETSTCRRRDTSPGESSPGDSSVPAETGEASKEPTNGFLTKLTKPTCSATASLVTTGSAACWVYSQGGPWGGRFHCEGVGPEVCCSGSDAAEIIWKSLFPVCQLWLYYLFYIVMSSCSLRFVLCFVMCWSVVLKCWREVLYWFAMCWRFLGLIITRTQTSYLFSFFFRWFPPSDFSSSGEAELYFLFSLVFE